MVRPCLYTALTTIVAFASLIFSDIKPVIDFGYMMTFGLIVTFITSFILLPSILLLSRKIESDEHGNSQFWFTKLLANLTINEGKYIVLITITILLSTVYGISQLRVENSFINYFKSNTEIYKGMRQIDEKLGGTTPLDIIIKFEDSVVEVSSDDEFGDGLLDDDDDDVDVGSQWFTIKKINKIKQVHDYLDSLPEVGKVLSLASTIRVAEKLNGDKELNGMEMDL